MPSEPARLVLRRRRAALAGAAANGFEIAFIAGYGDAPPDVPAPIRHALKLLVAHWFEHREPVALGVARQSAGDGRRLLCPIAG